MQFKTFYSGNIKRDTVPAPTKSKVNRYALAFTTDKIKKQPRIS